MQVVGRTWSNERTTLPSPPGAGSPAREGNRLSSATGEIPAGAPDIGRTPTAAGITPADALTFAFHDSLRLLFRPFDAPQWVKLSLICLFLGGGTTSAAFHSSLGSLPGGEFFREMFIEISQRIARDPALILLFIAVGIGVSLVVFYLRANFRFVLVDTIVRREVLIRAAAASLRRQIHSYFFWLLGALLVVGMTLGGGLLLAMPHLRAAAAGGEDSLAFVTVLAVLLTGEVLLGLLVALLITLTDDLVAPVMYSEHLTLPAAWRTLWRAMRRESSAFVLYILLRFVVSVAVGVAILLLLFPVLVAVFSGAIILGALPVLTLRLLGMEWVWNPVTIIVASLALLLLIGLLLILMSVAGMPGQVLLQNFGIRFIASRAPSLDALLRVPHHPEIHT